ncbi:hypothetical protein ACMHYB_06425 [Sorangium sp. So ce1128]
MTRGEKFLYHQIHPLKLATDFASSAASSWASGVGRPAEETRGDE